MVISDRNRVEVTSTAFDHKLDCELLSIVVRSRAVTGPGPISRGMYLKVCSVEVCALVHHDRLPLIDTRLTNSLTRTWDERPGWPA